MNFKDLFKNPPSKSSYTPILMIVTALSIGIYIFSVITRVVDPNDLHFFRAFAVSKEFYSPLFIFAHANIIHIGFNLFFFHAIARGLETRGVPLRKFLLLLLYTYLGSYLATVLYTALSPRDILTVGISGVVIGMYLYYMYLTDHLTDAIAFLVLIHLLGFAVPALSLAWWAHAGGLLGAAVLMYKEGRPIQGPHR